jgi:hypothetical protein
MTSVLGGIFAKYLVNEDSVGGIGRSVVISPPRRPAAALKKSR